MSRILTAIGLLADQVKINAVHREICDGRSFWIKKRRWLAKPILAGANAFFRVAGNPVQAIADLATWQQWEVDCYLRLHGEAFQASAQGRNAVAAEEMPGKSLAAHLDTGSLEPKMLRAAGRELRRAHAAPCEFFGAAWSHGDPHSGNFIYEPAADRTRLIDFEVQHDRRLCSNLRHADDLLVLLQDVAGRISADQWLVHSRAFLEGYDRPEIVALLRQKLVVPGGFGRLWWAVRTTYMASEELERRVELLRAAI